MSALDQERIKNLLRQALPPVADEPAESATSLEPSIDLWPLVLRRLDEHPGKQSKSMWVWFDWALLAGVAIVTVSFPASIPMLLYYL